MEIFSTILTVIVVAVSLLSIVLVLVQSSKGGGGSLFGDSGGQNFIGTERKGDFFSRLTAIFLGIFLGGSLLLAYFRYKADDTGIKPPASVIQEKGVSEIFDEGDGKKKEAIKKKKEDGKSEIKKPDSEKAELKPEKKSIPEKSEAPAGEKPTEEAGKSNPPSEPIKTEDKPLDPNQ